VHFYRKLVKNLTYDIRKAQALGVKFKYISGPLSTISLQVSTPIPLSINSLIFPIPGIFRIYYSFINAVISSSEKPK